MSVVKDCIYRYIELPAFCRKILDTPEFQRLRRVRQLGVAHYIYPSAVHTRFEHSLGVMHLAGLAVDNVARNSGESVTDHEKKLIMIAGLLHDFGHMAYSHLFDDVAGTVAGLSGAHEDRSCEFLKLLRNVGLTEEDNVTISKMIRGEIPRDARPWKFQIVNNKLCDVDVDKMDYLQRDAYHTGIPGFQPDYVLRQMTVDADGNLAFKEKARTDVQNIFETRKRMFANVYFHKTTVRINAILRGAIADSIRRLTPSRVKEHFQDDFHAESYLRHEYPNIFDLVDRREFQKALEIGNFPSGEQQHAQYINGFDNLSDVMKRVIFV